MSGPKIGRYRLTKEQRLIMKELRERHLKLESEYRKIAESCGTIDKTGGKLEELLRQIGQESASDLHQQGMEFKKRIGQRQEDARKVSERYRGLSPKSEGGVVQKEAEEAALFCEAFHAFYKKTEAEWNQVVNACQKGMADAIQKGMSLHFNTLGQEHRHQVHTLLEEAAGMDLNRALREKERQICKTAKEHTDEAFFKTWYSLTVLPFIKECRSYVEEKEQCHPEWKELVRRHAALLKLMGRESSYASGEVNERYEPAQAEWSADAMKRLREETLRLENEWEKEQEQIYIREKMDQVMEDMGYLLAGTKDVVKKSGKRFRNELYILETEEETAVNVTLGEDGRITMELGKIDVTDRMPSERESEELSKEMEEFCDDFGSIRKKLEAYGIVADELSMLPAGQEFAQIININEYQMHETGHKRKGYDKRESYPVRKYIDE